MSEPIIGYTSGVFDLFHVGHLNILRNAKGMCDELIVGVSTDELVFEYKQKHPIIPFAERCEILQHIVFVDTVVPQESLDKMAAWKRYRFHRMFVGDDWQGHPKWEAMEDEFGRIGVRIVYFPYTQGTSSTKINRILDAFRSK